ncbi:MAG: anti-sigma factor antagonist [Clostridia bacterium]
MKYDYEIIDGTMTVKLCGEMDHHSAKTLRTEIDAIIEVSRPLSLILDASKINFCDSSGLGFIMGRYKKITTYGGTLILKNPSISTQKILIIAGMDKLIKTEFTRSVNI